MMDIKTNLNISVRDAMKMLSKSGQKSLVIVDDDNLLIGTLSDGDIRKAILNGADMGDSIKSYYQPNPTTLTHNKFKNEDAKDIFKINKFDLIPVIDERSKLVDILFWENVFGQTRPIEKVDLNVSVVIMAGGKGTRLEPFTKILPKPLVPIHDKPIIEHIMNRFADLGMMDFYLTINYKGKILKAYFEEIEHNYNIKFIEEKTPLGTAGCLFYLKNKVKNPVFITNCDIIIKADYKDLYKFHSDGDYDITLVASTKELTIPYGTCILNEEGHLSHIYEKPKYDFLINAGLYILNPEILNIIPNNKFYHITELIDDAKKQGKKIGVYPIAEEDWIDIGQWAEYKKAIDRL